MRSVLLWQQKSVENLNLYKAHGKSMNQDLRPRNQYPVIKRHIAIYIAHTASVDIKFLKILTCS